MPADESFSGIKTVSFGAKTLYSTLHALIPTLESTIIDSERGFPYFTAIDTLFNEGVNLPQQSKKGLKTIIPRLIKSARDTGENILRFETPDAMDSKKPFLLYYATLNSLLSTIFKCKNEVTNLTYQKKNNLEFSYMTWEYAYIVVKIWSLYYLAGDLTSSIIR